MVNEYKKIVLLKGLEAVNEYQFSIIKSLLACDLQLSKQTQDEYDRIKIADLMEEKFGSAKCVDILIELFSDIPQLKYLAKTLRNEKLKVAKKIKGKEKAMKKNRQEEADSATPATTSKALTSERMEETSGGQKRKNTTKQTSRIKRNKISEEQNQLPCPSEASTSATTGHPPQVQTSSSTPSSTSLFEETERKEIILKEKEERNATCKVLSHVESHHTFTQATDPNSKKPQQEQDQHIQVLGTSSISPTESCTQMPVMPPVLSRNFSFKKGDRVDSMLKEKEEGKTVCPASPHIKSLQTFTQTSELKKMKLPQQQSQHILILGTGSTTPTESRTEIPMMSSISTSSSYPPKKNDKEGSKLKEKEERKLVIPASPPVKTQLIFTQISEPQKMKLPDKKNQYSYILGTKSTPPTGSSTQIPVILPESISGIFTSKKSDREGSMAKEKEEKKVICSASPLIKSQHTFTQTPESKRMKLSQQQSQHAVILGISNMSSTESQTQTSVMPQVFNSNNFASKQNQYAHILGKSSISPEESQTQIPVMPSEFASRSFETEKIDRGDSMLKEKGAGKTVCPPSSHIKSQHMFTQTSESKSVKLPQEQTEHALILRKNSTSPAESQTQQPVMPPLSESSSFASKKTDSGDGILKEKEERKALYPALPPVKSQHIFTQISEPKRTKLLQKQSQHARIIKTGSTSATESRIQMPVIPPVTTSRSFLSKNTNDRITSICHSKEMMPSQEQRNRGEALMTTTLPVDWRTHILLIHPATPSKSLSFKEREDMTTKINDSEKMKLTLEQSQLLQTSATSTSPTESYPQSCVMPSLTPPSNSLTKKTILNTASKEASKEVGIQKGPKKVMVLKATNIVAYEYNGEERKMFHATVATESEFFKVKVFDISLKKKFAPKRIITISDYVGRQGFLEVYNVSKVSEVNADEKMEIPKTLIKNANATPKISHICLQPEGTFVSGVFMVHNKMVRDKCTYYEIKDNTGKMEVMLYGRSTQNCQEGDKLQLICFELSFTMDRWQLRSVTHSFIKVIKTRKHSNQPLNPKSNMET